LKLLLDECVDSKLARHFAEFEISTVPKMGWASVRNGELLKLAEAHFDVLITSDRNMSFQQKITGRDLAVIILVAHSNGLKHLELLVPSIKEALKNILPGNIVHVVA
jgi:predicted nuclease of predicted toxin-antitoxin system